MNWENNFLGKIQNVEGLKHDISAAQTLSNNSPLSPSITKALHPSQNFKATHVFRPHNILKIKPTSNSHSYSYSCWKINFHLASVTTLHLALPSLAHRCQCSHCQKAGSKCSSRKKGWSHQNGKKWLSESPGLQSVLENNF